MAGSMHIPSTDTAEVCRDWRRIRLTTAYDVQSKPQDGAVKDKTSGQQVRLTAGRHLYREVSVCLRREGVERSVDRQISVSHRGRFLRGQPVGTVVWSRHTSQEHARKMPPPRAEGAWQVESSDENAETPESQCRIASGPC